MNRQIVSVGITGIIIGFIIGFFVGRGFVENADEQPSAAAESMPENHPGVDIMERIHALTLQAEDEPGNVQIRVQLGNTFYDMGRYDVAARWYAEALELDPEQPLVSTDLGTSLLFLGQTDAAVIQYRHSLSIHPGHPQTMQNLGVAFFSMGRYPEAIEIWKQLLEESPDYAEAGTIREQIATAEERMNSREGDSN